MRSLRVPVGTQLLDADEGLVADLATAGARYVAARGGAGGRGNARFATPSRQTPRFAETGLPGEEAELVLRLKLVVDAALAGFPNAGKSSLLRRISNAKPKVADYPFTTLEPVLGTVDGPEERQLTVADVPGLIEGAADGAGLGHEFLAHLERARLLVHVLDASESDLEERFRAIDRELAAYGAGLAERRQIVVLNKIDLLEQRPPFELDDPRVVARPRDVVRDRGGDRRAEARALRALPGGGGGAAGGGATRVPRVPPEAARRPAVPHPTARTAAIASSARRRRPRSSKRRCAGSGSSRSRGRGRR